MVIVAADPHHHPAFERRGPAHALSPVVLAVPHAGREYPSALLAGSRLPRAALETLEDRHVDRVIDEAVAEGSQAIVARHARAWIDLNRDPREIDPAMVHPAPRREALLESTKLRGGLGLIPRRIAGHGEIARAPISWLALQARIAQDHAPYHAAVAAALEAAHRRFGRAILLDCHSMPPLGGPDPARIVIGDRHGASASREVIATVLAAATASGRVVARNQPYAGGHTLDRHGDPQRGTHAVQIEFDRSLYLAPDLMRLGTGAGEVGAILAAIVRALADAAPLAQAAE